MPLTRIHKLFWFTIILTVALAGCSDSDDNGVGVDTSYDQVVADGWEAFARGDYATARERFAEAKSLDGTLQDAFVGMGWALFKLDDLSGADAEFDAGEKRGGISPDLLAGWAFVQNALKEHFASNTTADALLTAAPNWSFAHGLALDSDDVHILKAENYFVIGDFAASLSEVQMIIPSFTADITTPSGQAALASEIERLRTV